MTRSVQDCAYAPVTLHISRHVSIVVRWMELTDAIWHCRDCSAVSGKLGVCLGANPALHPIKACCRNAAAARGFLQAYERYQHRKSGSGHPFRVGAAIRSLLCCCCCSCTVPDAKVTSCSFCNDCDREMQRQLLRLAVLTCGQTLCLLAHEACHPSSGVDQQANSSTFSGTSQPTVP